MTLPAFVPMAPSETLAGWLEKAVGIAFRAVEAIDQGDDHAATQLVDELRFAKAKASPESWREAAASPAQALNAPALQMMRCAMETLSLAEAAIHTWISQRVRAVAQGEVSDPIDIWQRLIDQALPASWDFDKDLFVVLGDPDAYLVTALEQRGQGRVVFLLDGQAPPTLPQPGSGWSFPSSDSDLETVLGSLAKPYPERVASLNLREDGESQRARTAAQTRSVEQHLLSLWTNHNTHGLFGSRWLEQGVGNLPLLAACRNLHELDGLFKGRPAVLIAPGPSLDKNLEQIRDLKGRALLLAPLQVLRRLHRAGIQPDFVVVLDPQDQTRGSSDFFKDVPAAFLPPLIAAVNTHPDVLAKFETVYCYGSGGPLDHWAHAALGAPLPRLMAPSVALTCLQLARHWQCSPIVLTGQDLALSNGQQYATGSHLVVEHKRRLYSLPGYHGGTVSSPSDYYVFHLQFQLMAKDIAKCHPEMALYNCTEGGAYIEGFEHRPLRDVAATILARPVCPVPPMPASPEDAAGHGVRTEAVRRFLLDIRQTIEAANRQAGHCHRLSMTAKPGSASLKTLALEERRLRQMIQQISGFSVLYQDRVERALQASARATSLRENLQASRALYAVVSEGCDVLLPLVQAALARCAGQDPNTAAARPPCVACA